MLLHEQKGIKTAGEMNLVLEETAASQRAGPSPGPGPPGLQRAPGAEAETSGTVRSGEERASQRQFC